MQLLTYAPHLNIPANMQEYLAELNGASGLKRIASFQVGPDRAYLATAELFVIGFGTLWVLRRLARRSTFNLQIDDALETWICLQFMGLADSAFEST